MVLLYCDFHSQDLQSIVVTPSVEDGLLLLSYFTDTKRLKCSSKRLRKERSRASCRWSNVTALCLFLGFLLIIGGVESNPGPGNEHSRENTLSDSQLASRMSFAVAVDSSDEFSPASADVFRAVAEKLGYRFWQSIYDGAVTCPLTDRFIVCDIPGDGNCLFSCFSLLLTGKVTSTVTKQLRKAICDTLTLEMINTFGDEYTSVADYLRATKMRQNGIFGTEVEIRGFCKLTGLVVYMHTSLGWTRYSETNSSEDFIGFVYMRHQGVHYEVVRSVSPCAIFEDSDDELPLSSFAKRGRSMASSDSPALNSCDLDDASFDRKRKLARDRQRRRRERLNTGVSCGSLRDLESASLCDLGVVEQLSDGVEVSVTDATAVGDASFCDATSSPLATSTPRASANIGQRKRLRDTSTPLEFDLSSVIFKSSKKKCVSRKTETKASSVADSSVIEPDQEGNCVVNSGSDVGNSDAERKRRHAEYGKRYYAKNRRRIREKCLATQRRRLQLDDEYRLRNLDSQRKRLVDDAYRQRNLDGQRNRLKEDAYRQRNSDGQTRRLQRPEYRMRNLHKARESVNERLGDPVKRALIGARETRRRSEGYSRSR